MAECCDIRLYAEGEHTRDLPKDQAWRDPDDSWNDRRTIEFE